jgi:hypothetical protein
MALFARRRPSLELLPVEGHDELALVPASEVEELVEALASETFDYVVGEELPPEIARALAAGLPGVTELEAPCEETIVTARSVARIGYMARVAERERVPAARRRDGWMSSGLRDAVEASVREELSEPGAGAFYGALAAVTAFFVNREPLDVGYDAEGLRPMWTIPGMGGDFRALLRDRTLARALERTDERGDASPGPAGEASLEDLRRVWKYGFLLRAFEEFFQAD